MWMHKIFRWSWERVGLESLVISSLYKWSVVCRHHDWHGLNILRWQLTDLSYVHKQVIKLLVRSILSSQSSTLYNCYFFFPPTYSEKEAWQLLNMTLSKNVRQHLLRICTHTQNELVSKLWTRHELTHTCVLFLALFLVTRSKCKAFLTGILMYSKHVMKMWMSIHSCVESDWY